MYICTEMKNNKENIISRLKEDPQRLLAYFEYLLNEAYRLEQEKETEEEKYNVWGDLYDRLFCIPVTGDYHDGSYHDIVLTLWPDFTYSFKNDGSDKSDVECFVRSFRTFVETKLLNNYDDNLFPTFDQWKENKEITWS